MKALGLALLGATGTVFALLGRSAASQWPPAADRLAPFALGVLVAVNLLAIGLLALSAGCGASRSLRDRRSRRAILLQWLLANLLVPLVAYSLISSETSADADLAATGLDVAVAVVGYALAFTAWRLWRRAQRHEAPDADEAMKIDPRPPVLYLRSFRDDGAPVIDDGGSTVVRRFMAALAPTSPEQELADILAHVGPVVAIGKPGEQLPELGAARLYVDHARWQSRVAELMRSAALVVIRVGSSPGVVWEVEQALRVVPRQRLVIALLGQGAIAPELGGILPPGLQSMLAATVAQAPVRSRLAMIWRRPSRGLGGFVCFDAAGRPDTVPVEQVLRWDRDASLALCLRPSAPPLRRAWRQLFPRLGIDPGAIGARRSRAVAVLLAVFFGYAGAHWFYLGDRRRGWRYIVLCPLALASLFMAFADALHFVWEDRATFDARFGGLGLS